MTERNAHAVWSMRGEVLAVQADWLAARMAAMRAEGVKAAPTTVGTAVTGGGIAVVPVCGFLSQRSSLWMEFFGGCATDQLTATLRALAADASVRAVLLDIDSPGGEVNGIPDAADAVRQCAAQKPVWAFADSLMCSAAYWIGSQATKVVARREATVGSVGVWTMHADQSALMESMGVKVTLISAGDRKTEGNPYEPLSEDARAAIQADVDACYRAFTAAVARGRGVPVQQVRDTYGQGRGVRAEAALAAGMVDAVSGTVDDVVADLAKSLGGTASRKAKLAAVLDLIR